MELFREQEAAALMPLPRYPYDCAEVALRVCDLDGYLDFETNRYPVPYEYVTDWSRYRRSFWNWGRMPRVTYGG